MKKIKYFIILCLLCSVIYQPMWAKVQLPSLLADNMVLQQQCQVKLWGKSNANTSIRILCSWLSEAIITETDSTGLWEVLVKTPSAGGPYEIEFDDGDKLVLKNILIGEVWLCSGQSNMEMPIKGFYAQPVWGSNQVIADATPDCPIRLFTVKKDASISCKDDVSGCWLEHAPESVANFSATGYFFGQQLYRTLKVPVGLIHSSWGGSKVEAWMPEEALKLYPEISLSHLIDGKKVKEPQRVASLLYNGMLYPLRNYCIKGIVWYQGEANRLDPEQYKRLFPDFVRESRKLFRNDSLPFCYAQIAPFGYQDEDHPFSGVLLREAQAECEKLIPNVKMAVLTDIGEDRCVHPSHKKEVGIRLAYQVLSQTYYKKGISGVSPRYVSKKISDGKVELAFENVGLGLTSFGQELSCFEIADSNRKFHRAKAIIHWNKVIVWNDTISEPIAVRYAFHNYVRGDLFGCNGLPVSSFRTDF